MFDWAEYVLLAAELQKACLAAGVETPDAKTRSAVSRAYYGAFHVAKDYLERTYQLKTTNHGQVWNELQRRERSDDEKTAGADGDRLMDLRTNADYKLTPTTAQKNAVLALTMARNVCKCLGRNL